MSTNIPKISLEDSLYVLQLAREAALARNRHAQAERMMPVVEQMRGLVASSYQQPAASPASGVMGQSDFRALLSIAQVRSPQPSAPPSTASVLERNRLIGAMAGADMSEIDIARQFSLSREEVHLILTTQQKNKAYGR